MNLLELFKPIDTFVFETDGVLADEVVSVNETGGILYHLNSKDVFALRMALAKGYKVWLTTSGKDEWLAEWRKAGVHIINRSYINPKEILRSIQAETDYKNILYTGADILSVPLMKDYWLSTCPANAVPEIKELARYISPFTGGNGCVRDVVEKVLKLKDDWQVPV